VRIKAIEALGRMRAYEAAELLRTLAENREGLTYAEPAGLRAAAEDALALIENRPSFKQAAAAFGAPAQSSSGYVIPRRYVRVPLESPLRAHIEGVPAGLARVKTISLGGAYLESPRKLSVGDSIKLEVRAGFRRSISPPSSAISDRRAAAWNSSTCAMKTAKNSANSSSVISSYRVEFARDRWSLGIPLWGARNSAR